MARRWHIPTLPGRRGDAWAGQMIERDGKFFYYVPVNKKNAGNAIGVAVSDTPEGPYKDALGKPLIDSATGNIDPTPFIDDNGQAYLYWGNPALKYVKLNKDMVSYDQTIGTKGIVTVPLTAESFGKTHRRRQTSHAFRRRAMALQTQQPVLHDVCRQRNPGEYLLLHRPHCGRALDFQRHYHAHRRPRRHQAPRHQFHQSFRRDGFQGAQLLLSTTTARFPAGAATNAPFVWKSSNSMPDGTFPTIPMTDTGPAAIAHLDPFQQQQAATICFSKGVKTTARVQGQKGVFGDSSRKGCLYQGGQPGFWQQGDGEIPGEPGRHGRRAMRSSCGLTARRSDVIGTLKVKPTGALDKWESQTTTVTGVKGIHDLYMMFTGSGTPLMNVDTWKFE